MRSNAPHRFVTQCLVILVRGCTGLIWASAGPLLPLLMQNYGINRGAAGWFASAAPLTIAIVTVPLGIGMARFNLKKVFAVGAFLQGAGILAPFCTSYFPILLTRVCFAIGTAIVTPIAIAITMEWFTARELPLLNGITISFINLGNVVAFVATVPLATFFSWKAPIIIYAAIALTFATAWVIFGRNRGKAAVENVPPSTPKPEMKKEPSIREVLTQRSTILMVFAVMGAWCLGNAMGSWLPSYYHEVFKMSLERASTITAVITVGGIAGSISGGVIPMRMGRRKPFLVIPGALIGLAAISALLSNNLALILLSVFCFGVLSNLCTPTLYTIPIELHKTSPRSGVLIISAIQCGGNLGNFIGPLIVGYLADITGSYLPGFIICAAISLSLLIAGLLLPETGPKAKKLVVIEEY